MPDHSVTIAIVGKTLTRRVGEAPRLSWSVISLPQILHKDNDASKLYSNY